MSQRIVRTLAVLAVLNIYSCGDDGGPAPDAGADAANAGGVCGNGKVEGAELCDGADLDNETCQTVGDGMYTAGTLRCNDHCTFDLTECTGGDSGLDDMDGGGGGTGG